MNIQGRFPLLKEMAEVIKRSMEGTYHGMTAKSANNGFRPDPATLFTIPKL